MLRHILFILYRVTAGTHQSKIATLDMLQGHTQLSEMGSGVNHLKKVVWGFEILQLIILISSIVPKKNSN